jgi:dUTP pyrophosphatase
MIHQQGQRYRGKSPQMDGTEESRRAFHQQGQRYRGKSPQMDGTQESRRAFEFKGRFNDTYLMFVKMSSEAHAPTRATPKSAGLDIKAAEACLIQSGARKLVSTKLRICIPEGYYGRLATRSSMALKAIDVCAGVIDSDYRGELKVLLHNFGQEHYIVQIGDKIAQLICERISLPIAQEVQDLPVTKRGNQGFGSSGT